MTYHPNFKDFYRVAVIPMGTGRDLFLKDFKNNEIYEDLTHWFVAIEGSLKSDHPEYFQWKVIVFPSREDGSYHRSVEPYFESSQFDTIDESIELSRLVIQKLKDGILSLYEIST